MSPFRLTLFPLLLALATSASAQENADSRAVAAVFAQGFDQAVYKGLVGNVLDAIPMDPSGRLSLQRTNAVVSSTFLGRSLTVLAGLTNPVLLLGGFVWGMWSAANIRPAEPDVKRSAEPGLAIGAAAAQARMAMLLERTSRTDDTAEVAASEPILLSSISTEHEAERSLSHPRIIKVWLPQHPAMPPR